MKQIRSASAIVIDLRLPPAMSPKSAQRLYIHLQTAIRNQLHIECQQRTWSSDGFDHGRHLDPTLHIFVCPQLPEKKSHLLLSPPYSLQESYRAINWLPSSSVTASNCKNHFSNASILKELIELHERLKASSNQELSEVFFFSPLVLQSGFFSKSTLELIQVLFEYSVHFLFIACSLGMPSQQIKSKVKHLRADLRSYTNIELACIENGLEDIQAIFQHLSDTCMSRRSRTLAIQSSLDCNVLLNLRPAYSRLELPAVVDVCKCHRRYPRNCPKSKARVCMQNVEKTMRIGRGHFRSILDPVPMAEVISGTLLAIVEKQEISPALTVGQPLLVNIGHKNDEKANLWWRQLLDFLWQEDKAAVIKVEGELCEYLDNNCQRSSCRAYSLIPLASRKPDGEQALQDCALLKKIAFVDELRSVPYLNRRTALDEKAIEKFQSAFEEVPIEEFSDDLLAKSIQAPIANIIRRGHIPIQKNPFEQNGSGVAVRRNVRFPVI